MSLISHREGVVLAGAGCKGDWEDNRTFDKSDKFNKSEGSAGGG